MFELRPIQKNTPEFEVLKQINDESFPAFERDNPYLFFDSVQGFRNDALGIFLNNELVGFIILWHGKTISYIAAFAIAKKCRGKGVGSKTLQQVIERCGDRCIALCAEQPDPTADNALEREKRVEFYAKNGFNNTGQLTKMYGMNFVVLSTTGDIPRDECRELIRALNEHFKVNASLI